MTNIKTQPSPPTAAQLEFLRRHGADIAHVPTRNLAAQLIDSLTQTQRHRRFPVRVPYAMPDSHRKWTAAESPISSLEELAKLIDGRCYIFTAGRRAGYHWSFVMNWQLWRVRQMIIQGKLFPGVRNPRAPWIFKADWHHSQVPDLDSTYFIRCEELRGVDFQARDPKYIMRRCREIVRRVTGQEDARTEVVFNDEERPW